MAQVYISLGCNEGARGENINRAVWAIGAFGKTKVQKVSGIYEAKKHELDGEAPGYFAAIRIETALSPEELLAELQKKENSFLENGIKVKLDILMFEGQERDSEILKLPHPEIKNRPHIICPLLNLYADKELKNALKELGEENVKYTGVGLYLPL